MDGEAFESEFRTRKTKIDALLSEQGWKVGDKTRVLEEVDSKQSDFKTKDYRLKDETWGKPGEHQYLDYLLLDRNDEPLVIVEAKRTCRDPIVGQRQALDYLKDVKKQYPKDVFVYLTNGREIWFLNEAQGGFRKVRTFHSREDLEKFRFQNVEKKKFHEVPINNSIINRTYQITAVKRVQEGMDRGKRKFLVVMATGTGKTRVAMALIDTLLKTNRVKNVLFLTDRRALRDQAWGSKGFKQFFPHEAKTKIASGTIDKSARLFVSTIQTLTEIYQEKDENGQNKISPGFFDLIISDEAHRSIYNKWKGVFTYFDAYQIGLTATPAEEIDRDTFGFFECDDSVPTYNYSFDEAVKDGWLVNFQVQKTKTHFQIHGIKAGDIPKEVRDRLMEEKGLDEQELNWDGSELEKKVTNKGTLELQVKEIMEDCLRDESGTMPAKTIVFALSHKHAKRVWETFKQLYPEYGDRLVQIIDYQMERAQKLLETFTNEKYPRIAISVDMLDTGVDVPEVCNLVFAKPVFSKIKFWQMIGRGSRNDDTCIHKEWLPDGKKGNFLIFDMWGNFDFFKMNPEGRESQATESLPGRIFKMRLEQFKILVRMKKPELLEKVKKRILKDIEALPRQSASLREHEEDIEKTLDPDFWGLVGLDQYEYLHKKMLPLMRYRPDINIQKASFELKLEKLKLALLKKDQKSTDALRDEIGYTLNLLPKSIRQVKQKEPELDRALSKSFWADISLDDVDMLETTFIDLMKYAREEPPEPIVLNLEDVIEERDWIEFGPNGEGDYVKRYREKVENRIKQLAETHPVIEKIKRDEKLTERDLIELEKTLNGPDLYISEEILRKVYTQNRGSIVQFIKAIIGLYKFPDANKRIDEAFDAFMVEKNYLNADQITFLRALQSVFASKHHVDLGDFYELPFTNISKAPTPLFNKTELKEIVDFCQKLEGEVFPA